MKHGYMAFVCSSLVAFLLHPAIGAFGQAAGASKNIEIMSVLRARRTVTAAAVFHPDRYHPKDFWYQSDRHFLVYGTSFRFTYDALEFDEVSVKLGTRHSSLDLKTLVPMSATCEDPTYYSSFPCDLNPLTGKPFGKDRLMPSLAASVWTQSMIDPACHLAIPGDPPIPEYPACVPERRHFASLLAAAFTRLGEFANDANAPLRTYTERAEAWRALSVKPAIPEDVRVRRLAAEDALKNKNLEEALAHYEIGLELYPTWPQGYFNAALIAAELGYFQQAIEHMQAYVDLVPDAADAQAARDQIAIWKFKTK